MGAHDRHHAGDGMVGILLVNYGAPVSSGYSDVRRYLFSVESDARFQQRPAIIRYPASLATFLDAYRMTPRYEQLQDQRGIFYDRANERLCKGIAECLYRAGVKNSYILFANRHSDPSIYQALSQMKGHGMRRLLVFPLLPQYSFMGNGSIAHEVDRAMKKLNYHPERRIILDYHDNQGYVDAIAASIQKDFLYVPGATRIIFAYSSVPYRSLKKGDAYELQTSSTSLAIAERCQFRRKDWTVGYLTGVVEHKGWLSPSVQDVLRRFADAGTDDVTVVCPGFPCDRGETIIDVHKTLAEYYKHLCPALPSLSHTASKPAAFTLNAIIDEILTSSSRINILFISLLF